MSSHKGTTPVTSPVVSVVISVYNDADTVAESVQSLLTQTFSDFEIVVVNDGSTDHSPVVLERLQKQDQRIRLFHQQNEGLTRALIRGCTEARGGFIARQDADDVSLPTRLEKQLAALQQDTTLSFVSCWAEGMTKEGHLLETVRRPADPELATHQLRFERQGPPAHGTVMFRRKAYEQAGGYRPEFYFSQDSDLWLRLAEIGPVSYIPEVLYRYRRDAESLSSVRHDIQYQFGEIGQACHAVRLNGGDESALLAQAAALTEKLRLGILGQTDDHARATATQYLIGSQLAQNGDPGASAYLWPVIRHRPWHVKAWARLLQSLLAARRPLHTQPPTSDQ